jgi:hypothetical protein
LVDVLRVLLTVAALSVAAVRETIWLVVLGMLPVSVSTGLTNTTFPLLDERVITVEAGTEHWIALRVYFSNEITRLMIGICLATRRTDDAHIFP